MADMTWEKLWGKDLCEEYVWERRVEVGEAVAEIIVREIIEEGLERDQLRLYGSVGIINRKLFENPKESEPMLFDETARFFTGFFGTGSAVNYMLSASSDIENRIWILSDLKRYLDAYIAKREPELKKMIKERWKDK